MNNHEQRISDLERQRDRMYGLLIAAVTGIVAPLAVFFMADICRRLFGE